MTREERLQGIRCKDLAKWRECRWFLSEALTWSDSVEGWDFWDKLDTKFLGIAMALATPEPTEREKKLAELKTTAAKLQEQIDKLEGAE